MPDKPKLPRKGSNIAHSAFIVQTEPETSKLTLAVRKIDISVVEAGLSDAHYYIHMASGTRLSIYLTDEESKQLAQALINER
jgi:hypothetical protein